jgi:hypothetical protein
VSSVGLGQTLSPASRLFDAQSVSAEAGACKVFPADNTWNQRIDTLPVHRDSAAWVRSIGETERLRAAFSADDGIPYQLVSGSTSPASVQIEKISESDPGPYRLLDDGHWVPSGRGKPRPYGCQSRRVRIPDSAPKTAMSPIQPAISPITGRGPYTSIRKPPSAVPNDIAPNESSR